MSALDQVDTWPPENVAAAVFDPTGILQHHGDIDRRFALASVSKVLAAITMHIAIEEGSIGLDDAAGPPGATIRHLLSHASGLGPDGDREPLGPPERRRIYSNVGFEVLAEHLGAATSIPYTDYATAALVDTLDLGGTDLSGSPAHAHTSTVRDLCTVLTAVTRFELLGAATVDAMTTPCFPDLAGVLPGYGRQDPNPWGLGVEVRGNKSPHWTSDANAPSTWGHFGRTGTFVWFDPTVGDRGIGLVALTDLDFDRWAIEAWPSLAGAVLAEHA